MHFYVTHPLHLKEEIQYLNPRIACHFLREGGGSEGEGIHRIWRLEREGGTKKGNFGVFWICNCIHPPFFYFPPNREIEEGGNYALYGSVKYVYVGHFMC